MALSPGLLHTVVALPFLLFGMTGTASAECSKDDRSGCDVPSAIAQHCCDTLDKMNTYTPEVVRAPVQKQIDSAREAASSKDEASSKNETSPKK